MHKVLVLVLCIFALDTGGATIQRLRHKESVSYDVLAKICELLHCQPGDLLEYVEDAAPAGNEE